MIYFFPLKRRRRLSGWEGRKNKNRRKSGKKKLTWQVFFLN